MRIETLTCNLVTILVAHEVQQVLEHIHTVALVTPLVFLQTRIDDIGEGVDALQQGVALAAVLVEDGVQIAGGFGFLYFLLELVDIYQALDAVEQILGTLLGLIVGFFRTTGLDALVLDDIFDFVQARHRKVLQIGR